MLATWLLGAVPQPISHRLPSAERAAIIELADPALVVGVNAEEAGGRPSLEAVPDDLPSSSQAVDPAVSPVWKILTSGGSTGRPKLIMAVQPALVENVMGFAELWRFPADGCVLVTGPMYHNAPFVVAILGLLRGNHMVVMPRFDASETLQLVERHRVQALYLVPTMMLRIWRLPEDERLGRDLSSLETVFHMAAPCPQWLKQVWIDWLGPDAVFELYAGTELQAMTVITGREWLDHRGSVGRPVLGEMEVRDSDGAPVAPLEVGEVWMRRGEQVPAPYRYVGATAKTAPDGWESLGDLGYLDDEGFVYLTDRDADMILVGGANVYPAEVEAALDEYPAVRSSCVIGLPHEDLGNVPHALVQLTEPTSDDVLLAHLRERLPPTSFRAASSASTNHSATTLARFGDPRCEPLGSPGRRAALAQVKTEASALSGRQRTQLRGSKDVLQVPHSQRWARAVTVEGPAYVRATRMASPLAAARPSAAPR